MRLHEYQSKFLFRKYGIPVPKGFIASTADEAKQAAEELGGNVVVKAQVLVGGRGKGGGIRLARSSKEAEDLAAIILGMDIKGLPVRKVLIDESIKIASEIYLSITVDTKARKPIIIASATGGENIEEVAKKTPELIWKISLDPLVGYLDFYGREIATNIDLPRSLWRNFSGIVNGLWQIFEECDATLAEINPLVITTDQQLVALDAKIILDDNALYRHQDLAEMRDVDAEEALEIEARKYGLSYVKLDGNVGCIVNGAGLAMATIDMINISGGKPANFLDIGGGASADRVSMALKMILSDPEVNVILINIFGGITRCDIVANGILEAVAETLPKVPIIMRLVGLNSEAGNALIRGSQVIIVDSLFKATQIINDFEMTGKIDEHLSR